MEEQVYDRVMDMQARGRKTVEKETERGSVMLKTFHHICIWVASSD